MTSVRCPACGTLETDPGLRFTCPGCARRLSWRGPASLGPVQLGLFGEAVPAAGRIVTRAATTFPAPQRDSRFRSTLRCHQDALAATTALFHGVDHDLPERLAEARSQLAGRSAGDLCEAAVGAALFLAVVLRGLEADEPGAGSLRLQSIGLWLAGAAPA